MCDATEEDAAFPKALKLNRIAYLEKDSVPLCPLNFRRLTMLGKVWRLYASERY